MSAFSASSSKPWVLNSGASSHMRDIKDKFPSLFFNNNIPPVNIANSIFFTICGTKVVHATASLSLDDVLFVSNFSVSLLSSGNLLHKIIIMQFF